LDSALRVFAAAFVLFAAAVQFANADPKAVKVDIIHEAQSRKAISILDIPPANDFIGSARMALLDANLAPGEDPLAPLNRMLAEGVRFFI
jgi:hypothetical protein